MKKTSKPRKSSSSSASAKQRPADSHRTRSSKRGDKPTITQGNHGDNVGQRDDAGETVGMDRDEDELQ
ncbi:MAG: hypothetical protein M3680_33845 [Myxococcota bacterium]|nr:hypothetical protein [Myxococcota bacterium]